MGKYRFTAQDFEGMQWAHRDLLTEVAARYANALIESWERESEKVYEIKSAFRHSYKLECCIDQQGGEKAIASAILWNPKPIGGVRVGG